MRSGVRKQSREPHNSLNVAHGANSFCTDTANGLFNPGDSKNQHANTAKGTRQGLKVLGGTEKYHHFLIRSDSDYPLNYLLGCIPLADKTAVLAEAEGFKACSLGCSAVEEDVVVQSAGAGSCRGACARADEGVARFRALYATSNGTLLVALPEAVAGARVLAKLEEEMAAAEALNVAWCAAQAAGEDEACERAESWLQPFQIKLARMRAVASARAGGCRNECCSRGVGSCRAAAGIEAQLQRPCRRAS